MRIIRIALPLAVMICASAQVIEFESGGLKYQTLTKNGLTIMFAEMPAHVREFSILQVAISNGSLATHIVRPENFSIRREDGVILQPAPAKNVVNSLVEKASRHDVIKLITTYEAGLYGNTRYRSTNGYEQRRQAALAELTNTRIKAAAAASAIAFVAMKLAPGQSTDGAMFFVNPAKSLGPGNLQVRAAGALFEFPVLSSN